QASVSLFAQRLSVSSNVPSRPWSIGPNRPHRAMGVGFRRVPELSKTFSATASTRWLHRRQGRQARSDFGSGRGGGGVGAWCGDSEVALMSKVNDSVHKGPEGVPRLRGGPHK